MPAPPTRTGSSAGAAPLPCRVCGRTYAAEVLACPSDGSVLPLEGRLLDGKFRLDHKIGDGGMASVWQATNTRVERTVAIKLMHTRYADDSELLSRFRNEAAAAGKIGSPHICDVLDFGESPIGPYIVMELLDGCSLADLIHQHRRLDPGLAVWIARQALAGLAAAHRAGIVHRDLKPENIHLCRAIRGQWIIKLMDFGISKFAADPNTAAGATLGTPHYMAPEQIQGASKVDARADLWSMGVILYEAITGVQLFARETVAAALAALRTFDPPPLSQHRPDAPRGLAEVVARCLVRAPDRRVASAEALAEMLLPFEQAGPRARAAVAAAGAGATVKLASREVGAVILGQRGAAPVQQTPPRAAASAGAPVPGDRVDPAASASMSASASASMSQQQPSVRSPRLPVPSSQRTGAQVSLGRGPTGAVAPADLPRTAAPVAPAQRPGPDGVKRTGAQPVAPAGASPAVVPAKPIASAVVPAKPIASAVVPAKPIASAAPVVKKTGASPTVSPARPIASAKPIAPAVQPGKPGAPAFSAAVRAGAPAAAPASKQPAATGKPAAVPPASADGKRPATPQRSGRPAPGARTVKSNQQMVMWVVLVAVIVLLMVLILVLALR